METKLDLGRRSNPCHRPAGPPWGLAFLVTYLSSPLVSPALILGEVSNQKVGNKTVTTAPGIHWKDIRSGCEILLKQYQMNYPWIYILENPKNSQKKGIKIKLDDDLSKTEKKWWWWWWCNLYDRYIEYFNNLKIK